MLQSKYLLLTNLWVEICLNLSMHTKIAQLFQVESTGHENNQLTAIIVENKPHVWYRKNIPECID